MNILFLILTMAVFQPLTAQAEAVFDDAGSFQVAKAVKLGRYSGDASASAATKAKNRGNTTQNVSGKGGGCFSNQYNNNGTCTACPTNAICNGTSTWYCKTNYWQNASAKTCVACTTASTMCPGKTEYKCKNQSGTVTATSVWDSNGRYKHTTTTDPSKCTNCNNPTSAKLYECNGVGRRCYGQTAGSWLPDNAHATRSNNENVPQDVSCEVCNNSSAQKGSQRLYECNGTQTRYCYGYKVAGNTFDNKYAYATNSGSTSCMFCPDRAICNGKNGGSNYKCKNGTGGVNGSVAYWRDDRQSDPNKCVDCPANSVCDGTTNRHCKRGTGGVEGSVAYWKDTIRSNPFSCVSCPANAVCDGSETYHCKKGTGGTEGSVAYWRDTTRDDWDECVACPTNGICDGSTTYTCKPGYYVNLSNKTCDSVYEKTVCNSGFTTKVSTNNGNTVYCVQP